MLCIIRVRKDYPEFSAYWDGEEYLRDRSWYCIEANPYSIPRAVFNVQVRNVNLGETCPDCGEGELTKAFSDDSMDWIWCEYCGAMDEDHWWSEVRLKIRWLGNANAQTDGNSLP